MHHDPSRPDDLRPDPLRRDVSAHLEAEVFDESDLVLAIAVAADHARAGEQLSITLDGVALGPGELAAPHGGRLHVLRGVGPGRLVVDYTASVTGLAPTPPATDLDWFEYIRPSRYCESDRLGPLARAEFADLARFELLAAVSSWVGVNIDYEPGSSRPIDGAVATLLGRAGVCRDFAHLTVALLRANGIPARVTSVYAPGLEPMDFHAVAEACVDGAWYVVDPTCLAPRGALVRIATGADAADTAFLTNVRGAIELSAIEITAVAGPELPVDDVTDIVQLR